MSRFLKTVILSAAGLALSTAATAGQSSNSHSTCGGQSSCGVQSSYNSSYAYSGSTSQYGPHTGVTGGIYSGGHYAGGNTQYQGFSGQLAGLGPNESLRPTTCPTAVYNPEGGQVLGCYNVVKPAPAPRPVAHTTYYRIVRPIIYVRYPVCCTPVAPPPPSPCFTACGPVGHHTSNRYGF